jgi:hypothetical protein
VLLDSVLAIAADPAIPDEQVGGLIRGEAIGWERLRAAHAAAFPPLPRDHGHLAALEGSYGYLRQFTPQVIEAVPFAGGTAATELLKTIEVLRELNASGARKVPDDAPTRFVPTRWRGYLEAAAKAGNVTAYRHYWELCALLALRDGLRSGDVWVPGSRRYADPAAYLLTPARWAGQRAEFCRLTGKPAAADAALAAVAGELHQALGELERALAAGDGLVRLDDAGDLVISPLTAEDIPAEAVALKTELTEMLPFAPIVSLLIELDQRTGFLDCFTHAGGKAARSVSSRTYHSAVQASTAQGMPHASAMRVNPRLVAWASSTAIRLRFSSQPRDRCSRRPGTPARGRLLTLAAGLFAASR